MPHPEFEWSQDGQEKLEVRVPLRALRVSGDVNAREIDVMVKEGDVVCVKHSDVIVLQQRFHDNVALDNWVVENGETLVMEFIKNDAESWPCLLRLPMKADDRRFLRGDTLDALLRNEMWRLPRDEELEAEAQGGAAGLTNDDFEDLLDDALDEVVAARKPAPAVDDDQLDDEPASEQQKSSVAYELKMTEEEFTQLNTIRDEAEAKIASADTSDEEREKQRERLQMVKKMTELSKKVRRLRSKRPTMDVLLEILWAEIYKGRLNHGTIEEEETEAFRDEEEREMTPDALLKKGVAALESNIEDAMHFLRLAAIHHNHPVSTCLLQRLYTQMRVLPKAAYFVYRRALMDDCEPSTNLIVGEFADKGMPLFPPYMALVVYFYQRSASVGSTHAMLTLANTFKNGAVTASPADDQSRERNADELRFLDWLQAAEDRGSPRAYFIRASLHTTGECGQEKSYKLAKQYIDRVKRTEPTILSKAPGLEARIQHMQMEESAKDSGSKPSSPTDAGPRAVASPSSSGAVATSARSAASRLEALERGAGSSANAYMDAQPRKGGMLSKGRAGNAAANKWKALLERTAKVGIAIYFGYCALFPLRVVLAPQAFEIMAYMMDLFGLGRFIVGGGNGNGPQGMF